MSKKEQFEIGQHVVYPAHGVGVVQGIEVQDIAGTQLRVLCVWFEKDKMTVRLPMNSSLTEKIRPLSTKKELEEAIEFLKTPSKPKKMMWSRRAQEYEAKINSGNILSITQVVRDLHRTASQPEHSYSERQIYQIAMDRLMREYAAVEQIDEDVALERLEKLLAA